MRKKSKKIGMIAGYGQFPALFSKAAGKKGYTVNAVAFKNQADSDIEKVVDGCKWLYLGELSSIISFFKDNEINQVVFAGGINKDKLFDDLHPDTAALELLSSITGTGDDAIMRAFAGALEKKGITVIAPTSFLPELLTPSGCWTKREPTEIELADLNFGFNLAKKIGELDIGQCLVIAKGSVMAVEAIDGTDATILRGGKLGQGNAVVIKVKKPGQDDRFDLPAIGMETILTMVKATATALGVDAGESIVFDIDKMIALADKHNIAILGMGTNGKA